MRSRIAVALSVIFMLANGRVDAAFEYPVGSVRQFAMSGCVNLFQSSSLDAYANPAFQPGFKASADLSWSRLYNMPDFELASGAGSWGYRALGVTAGVTQLGGADYYSEHSYLLAGSLALHHGLRAGVSINYMRIAYGGGYRSLTSTAFNLGTRWEVGSKVAIGLAVRNVNRPRYGSATNRLPLIGEGGISYIFSEKFSCHVLQRFEEHVRGRFALGQEIDLHRRLALRFGIATEPTEISGGFSIGVGRLTIDYGFRDNVYLGGTHRFGLRYAR